MVSLACLAGAATLAALARTLAPTGCPARRTWKVLLALRAKRVCVRHDGDLQSSDGSLRISGTLEGGLWARRKRRRARGGGTGARTTSPRNPCRSREGSAALVCP